jgi:putative sigma-54 modulation protein
VDTYADKPMSPEDAKLELKMTGAEFIMFKNADTGDTNVLYRKSDGNYGLVEPKF